MLWNKFKEVSFTYCLTYLIFSACNYFALQKINMNTVLSIAIDNQTIKNPLQSLQDISCWLTMEKVQFIIIYSIQYNIFGGSTADYNKVFPTGGMRRSPPTSQKSANRTTMKHTPLNRPPPCHIFIPQLNNSFHAITQ